MADSGNKSPSRFFGFRWAYLFLCLFSWSFFLSLVLLPGDFDYWLTPDFMAWHTVFGSDAEHLKLRLHGVFGLYFEGSIWHDWDEFEDMFYPIHLGAFSCIATLATLIACYVVPASGKSISFLAIRGIHTRGKITASIVLGLMVAGSFAGLVDMFDIDIDSFFVDTGIHAITSNVPPPPVGPLSIDYRPQSGIAHPISWVSVVLVMTLVGFFALLTLSYAFIGGDRYWQAERWTLIYSVLGLTMIVTSLFGIEENYWVYRSCDRYLGGCYSMFVVGWFGLVWAWSCRTILFLMMKRYEQAAIKAEQTTCFACGYDLQMLTSDHCPECGIGITEELLQKIRSRMSDSTVQTQAESRSTTR
ncbi:MAG: hypothetical protein AAGB26_10265 [Planctomycetota bacterium]